MRKCVFPLAFWILILLTAVLPVSAAETGSLTVLFRHEDQPVERAPFQIYKVAEQDGSGYALIDRFLAYSVQIPDDPDSEEWKTIAFTLSAYAARDQIPPLASGETDETGQLCFDGLSDGLYLVTGSPAQLGELLIFPQPMLVTVPYMAGDGTKDYEVVAEPKYEIRSTAETTVTRRALKIWKDKGSEQKRPRQITVQLLCNGVIYDEKTLNEGNQWSYTWEGLDASKNWQLTEKEVPEEYTVGISREDVTFTVTNTNTNGNPPPPKKPGSPTLPQTGQLWWPVPVLAGIGAVMLFLGIFLLLRKKDGPYA